MWPTLLSIGPLAVHSFGLLMAIGVFIGGFVLWQKGREEGLEEEAVMDSWLIAGLVGLILGRLVHVLLNWQRFGGSWYKMLFLTKFPGLSYEGVWLGVVVTMLVFAKVKNWNVWQYAETMVLALVSVEMFGWLGSFLGGSGLGKPTNWWWGLSFPGVESRRHPAQLVVLVLMWLLWLGLKKWEKEYRGFAWYQGKKGESQPGFLLAAYLVGLGLIKLLSGFLLEAGLVKWGLSYSQWLGLVWVVAGGLILVIRSGITVRFGEKKQQVRSKQVRPNRLKRKKQGFDYK